MRSSMKNKKQRYVLALWVENKPGVLAKVIGLFSMRGYSIDSLNASITDNHKISRITIVVHGTPRVIEQIAKHLHKLINTTKVNVMSDDKQSIEKELCLVRINAPAKRRDEILRLLEAYHARVEKLGNGFVLAETVMGEEETNEFLKLVRPFGILEIVRSGVVAI